MVTNQPDCFILDITLRDRIFKGTIVRPLYENRALSGSQSLQQPAPEAKSQPLYKPDPDGQNLVNDYQLYYFASCFQLRTK